MTKVQRRKRQSGAHRKSFIGRHRGVIARGLAPFGVEIFDGFKVQQTVDGLLVGIGVLIIHLTTNFHPPFGQLERIGHINRDCRHHDDHILPAEIQREDHRNHGQFQDQRPDRQQHKAQQKIHTFDAAFDDPAKTSGLAGDVIAHRQTVNMGERLQSQLAQRALAHAHENRIAQFAKRHCQQPRHAISNRQTDCAQRQDPSGIRHRTAARGPGQGIDGKFINIRRGRRHHFGADQQHQ